jgi:hypothetical protein
MSGRPLSGNSSLTQTGPGQYNPEYTNRPKSPTYKIGTAKRDLYNFIEDNPGPAQYSPSNQNISTRPKSPTYSIGTSKRTPLSVPDLPGPGNYNYKPTVGDGPKV